MREWVEKLKGWARALKRDVVALWIAAGDPRTPWLARLVAGFVAAYALSPIDLIPDFIPLIGHLDDLVIVPLGIALVVRLVPPALMSEFRVRAAERLKRPSSYVAAAVIALIWLLAAAALGAWLWHRFA
jgi:uncharacterized membrane protein YkvA (DUF1232 family)